jgi:outer-membrane receptor for ferric coprogen and ferric-rhodotorulic acid
LNELGARVEYISDRWNTRRLEADFSTPITSDGRWAMRVVGTHSDEDSWIDRYSNERDVAYVVVDGQLTEDAVLTLGYSYQNSESSNPLWGALPTVYSNGTQTHWDPSASHSMDWTFWDTRTKNAFAELLYELPGDWRLKLVASGSDFTEDSETVWYDMRPDRETGLGMTGWPGSYPGAAKVSFGDISLAGSVSLFGRDHDLVVGMNRNEDRIKNWTRTVPETDPIWGPTPAFFGAWNGTEIPRPAFGPAELASDYKRVLTRYYSAANWQLTDTVNLITGLHFFDVKTTGSVWWDPADEDADETSPYVGATWSVTDNTNLYASYSDIFQPQSEQDINGDFIGSAKGENYEIGVKHNMFDGSLLGSLALYKAELNNYAEWDGYDETTGFNWSRGTNIETQGVEIDFTGRVGDYVTLQAGYSFMDLVSADSGDQRTYLPEHTITLLGDADISALPGLSLGASLRWQSAIHYISSNTDTEVNQSAYALLGLNASYDINDQLTVALNVDNITDETYLTSIYWADIYEWDQAFYGEPRNVTLRVTYEW